MRGVSFAIPVLNGADLLPRCLESIRSQDYEGDVEIILADGGSTDGTQQIGERFGCRVVHNEQKLAEPGVALAMSLASHPLRVVMAADNETSGKDWLRRVVAALEGSGARGAYTHIVNSDFDASFCRYMNHLHADPFNWFVYGAGANPKHFGEEFPVLSSGEGWVVYDLTAGERPLLAMAQGFALQGDIERASHNVEDDILPLWELLDRGERLVYSDVGVQHHPVVSLGDFIRKYRRRTAGVLRSEAGGYRARERRLGPSQRHRRALWLPYSLSVVLPLFDALRGAIRDREPVWLWHPLACLGLSLAILSAFVEVRLLKR